MSIWVQLETLLEQHLEGNVVRTGLTCRHGLAPILLCCWSGPDAGRRFLGCSQVEQPCDFKYWIDEQFEGRAKKVIQDLVSMRHSMSELYQHSSEQWDQMYADRQIAKQQIRELKRSISEQRECIVILICFSIVIGCGLWLIV